MRNKTSRRSLITSLAPSLALLASACGGVDLSEDVEEDLGPYAEQMPWAEYMATADMSTVAGVADSGACTTAAIRGLSDQIVLQMNCVQPNLMGRIDNANVSLGAAALPYLQSPAADSLRRATQGRSRLSLNSTLRTVAQQWILYRWYQRGTCGVQLAASPGRSNHEDGRAIDTSSYDSWRGILANHGFRWFGSGDRVHFDYVNGGGNARGVLAFQRLWNRNRPSDRIAEDGVYGPQTEARIMKSPRTGFSGQQRCN